MAATLLAHIDRLLRPFAVHLPAPFVVRFYSKGRDAFLRLLLREQPRDYVPPEAMRRVLWGIPFRSPLMNAAGMFKNGEGYALVARQGAGAYLAGTTTAIPRTGNAKGNTQLPFAPYPQSGAASNWLGLPNKGHAVVAKRLAELQRINACPIGISIMSAPESSGVQALDELVDAIAMFDKAGVDFIELNESCPNAGHAKQDVQGLVDRLEYLSTKALRQRKRMLPVIVKFSNDTSPEQIPMLMDTLVALQYDGVNFGNTSTAYTRHRERISKGEQPLYDYFTSTFGGGISGRPLATTSLHLASAATSWLHSHNCPQEFHVIRTGGIEQAEDIDNSERAGVALNQWYTGYFEQLSRHGHNVYRNILAGVSTPSFPSSVAVQ